MKKTYVLLLAVVLSAALVSGCEKKKPAEKAMETAPAMEPEKPASEMNAPVAVEVPKDKALDMKPGAGAMQEGAKTEPMETAKEAVKTASASVDAEALFKSTCVACHGAGGKGTAMAPAFVGNDWVAQSPRSEIVHVIRNGREGADKRYKKFPIAMPAQKTLPDAQVEALAEYVKGLASK